MDAFAFSPRRLPTPQRRTPRSPLPPAACVDVQWTFLPPQALPRSPSHANDAAARSPLTTARLDANHELRAEHARLRAVKETAERHDQRVLYDLMGETQRQAMLDNVMAEMEAMALTPVRRLKTPRRRRGDGPPPPEQQASAVAARRASVLPTNGVQRDAELLPQRRFSALGADSNLIHVVDRPETSGSVSADGGSESSEREDGDDEDPMEDDDAVTATVRSGGAADDIPELRAIRDRQRRRLERTNTGIPSSRPHKEPHIRWQKRAHVCVAMDLPALLLDGDDDDDGDNDDDDDHDTGLEQLADLFPLSEDTSQNDRPNYRRRSMKLPNKATNGTNGKSPTQNEAGTARAAPDLSPSPRAHRIRKAPYGSWYVPQDEWWTLHETQQETLAELFPDEQPPRLDRHHCERERDGESSPQRRALHKQDASSNVHDRLLTHPDAWPSLLRSPIASPRVGPLVRASPRSVSRRPPPTSSHAVRSPRSSSTAPAFPIATPSPPMTSSGGMWSPSRDHTTREGTAPPQRIASVAAVSATPRGSLAAALPDAIAQRAVVLQREISQAYIAREYREYLTAKGARVPSYLTS